MDSSSEVVISICNRCEDTLKAPIIGALTLYRQKELLSRAGWETIYLTFTKGTEYLAAGLGVYCPKCAIIVKAYKRLR